jgi:hypothetical protein
VNGTFTPMLAVLPGTTLVGFTGPQGNNNASSSQLGQNVTLIANGTGNATALSVIISGLDANAFYYLSLNDTSTNTSVITATTSQSSGLVTLPLNSSFPIIAGHHYLLIAQTTVSTYQPSHIRTLPRRRRRSRQCSHLHSFIPSFSPWSYCHAFTHSK